MQEIIVIPGVHHGLQKHAYDFQMPHAAEPPVRCVNTAAYDSELPVLYLFAQKIVFRVQRLFMEASKPVEGGFLEQHEHARAERLYQQRAVLRDVVGKVKHMIASGAL